MGTNILGHPNPNIEISASDKSFKTEELWLFPKRPLESVPSNNSYIELIERNPLVNMYTAKAKIGQRHGSFGFAYTRVTSVAFLIGFMRDHRYH